MSIVSIVGIVVFAAVAFLALSMYKKIRTAKKAQQQAQQEYFEKKDYYRVLTSEKFDETPMEEITHAVLFHIAGKEDALFDAEDYEEGKTVYDVLTHGERLINTICQLELSMEGGRGSVHSFFIKEEFEKYRKHVDEAFKVTNCFEIADLMRSAARLAEIIALDLEDEENDITGEYANYNFSDYTQKLLSLLKSSGILEKTGQYIKANKEEFIVEETGSEAIDEEGTDSEV